MNDDKTKNVFREFDLASKILMGAFVCLALVYPFIISHFTPHSWLCSGGGFALFLFSKLPLVLFIVLPLSSFAFHRAAVNFAMKNGLQSEAAKGENFFRIIFAAGSMLSVVWLAAFIFAAGARDSAFFGKVGSDIQTIKAAQDEFQKKHFRYADNQEDLVKDGLLRTVLTDPYTMEEYADADGSGIEGGDNDDQTWAAKAGVYGGAPSTAVICGIEKPDSDPDEFYFCDQRECRHFKKE